MNCYLPTTKLNRLTTAIALTASLLTIQMTALVRPSSALEDAQSPSGAEDLVVTPISTEGIIPSTGQGEEGTGTAPLIPSYFQVPENSRLPMGQFEIDFGPQGCNRLDQLSICIYQ